MCLAIFDGASRAVVGVEVALPTLAADLRDFTWQIITVDLIVIGVIVVTVIILLLLTVIRPIRMVVDEAERFAADNSAVSEKLGKIRTHDEIQSLSAVSYETGNFFAPYIDFLAVVLYNNV